jgi:hypothetical protein
MQEEVEEVIVLDIATKGEACSAQKSRRVSFCLPTEETNEVVAEEVASVGEGEKSPVSAGTETEQCGEDTATEKVANDNDNSLELVNESAAPMLPEAVVVQEVHDVERGEEGSEVGMAVDSSVPAISDQTSEDKPSDGDKKPEKKSRARKPKNSTEPGNEATPRASKRTPKASAKASVAESDVDINEKDAVNAAAATTITATSSSDKKPVKVPPPLPAAVQKRVDVCKKRLEDAAAELSALEA